MLGITIKSFFEQCQLLDSSKIIIDDVESSKEDILDLVDTNKYDVQIYSTLRRVKEDLTDELIKELSLNNECIYPILIIEIRRKL